MAITISGSGITSANIADGTITTDDILASDVSSLKSGRKNLIINGAMQVAQRGTSWTSQTGGAYYLDRMRVYSNNLGVWSVNQSTDSPNGFSNSIKITCTTANASPTGNERVMFVQRVEAQNLQQLAYGTSAAKAMTLSFWVKSNKTGNGTVLILQDDNSDKFVSPSYEIDSANTWEFKTILIPADTSGVINNDNGTGLNVNWFLNSSSDYTSGTNQTNWTAYDATDSNASNLGVGESTSDYFAITGVQLELGSVATDFEHRSYGEELALCQRYYERLFSGLTDTKVAMLQAISTTKAYGHIKYELKRDIPTVTFSSQTGWTRSNASGSRAFTTAIATRGLAGYGECGIIATSTGFAAGNAVALDVRTGTMHIDAEL